MEDPPGSGVPLIVASPAEALEGPGSTPSSPQQAATVRCGVAVSPPPERVAVRRRYSSFHATQRPRAFGAIRDVECAARSETVRSTLSGLTGQAGERMDAISLHRAHRTHGRRVFEARLRSHWLGVTDERTRASTIGGRLFTERTDHVVCRTTPSVCRSIHPSTSSSIGDLLAAVRAAADVSPRASTVVDATDTGGRRRVPLRAVDPDPTITYVRVEPAMAWRLAWQRRTENVAVLTGTPASATVRELHRATGGTGWDHAERTALDRLLSE